MLCTLTEGKAVISYAAEATSILSEFLLMAPRISTDNNYPAYFPPKWDIKQYFLLFYPTECRIKIMNLYRGHT